MKLIWNEHIFCRPYVLRWWDAAEVKERSYPIAAIVNAWYDKATKTLRIEMVATGSEADWMLERGTILETAPSREAAIRLVIGVADSWVGSVSFSVPAPDIRTDAQVEADYRSSRDNALLASGVAP